MSAALDFLRNCDRRKTLNRKRSSYGWKHVAERAMGEYISNDDFIAAARELGFTVRMIPGSPNAYINISEKAVPRRSKRGAV